MTEIKKKLVISTMVTAITLSAITPAVLADNTLFAEADPQGIQTGQAFNAGVTRGETVRMLLSAAESYTPNLTKEDIIKGYEDGFLYEQQPITRVEALTMISRAFGTFDIPEGYIAQISPKPVSFSDVPQWAENDIQNLIRGRLLTGNENGLLEPNQTVTEEQIRLMIYRIYAYKGSNVKDDFYMSANKQKLNDIQIPDGQSAAGGSDTVAYNTKNQINEIIKEIVSSGKAYKNGSDEQKIRDLYDTLTDMQTRNSLGTQPLKKYFDRLDSASTLSELAEAQAEIINSLGKQTNGLIPFYESADIKDNSKRVLNIIPGLGNIMESTEQYHKFLVKQMILCNISEEQANILADEIIQMEKKGAENVQTNSEENHTDSEASFSDIGSQYTNYTVEDIKLLAPDFDVSKMLKKLGYDDSITFQVIDKKGFENVLSHLKNEKLQMWKAQIKITVLEAYHQYLSREIIDMYNDAYKDSGYTDGLSESVEKTAIQSIENYLSDEVGRIYVSKHFVPEAKKDIENLVEELIDTFKLRINRLEWMSEETKKEAIKKLNALDVKIGYPDVWPQSEARIKSIEEGGNAFDNMVSIFTNTAENDFGALRVFTVNAAANRQTNTIIFPAGILQPPFYDINASREENLGGIGTVIAHEITHVFDDQGAKYDSKGNIRDWWTQEEHDYFNQACKKVIRFYDGWEAAPGIAVNGENTLSENIADIGAMACVIDMLNKMDNPNYDQFFRAYAETYINVTSREDLLNGIYDEHAPKNLRVNRVLANFEEFIDTYQIKMENGMYVAPKDRITIW